MRALRKLGWIGWFVPAATLVITLVVDGGSASPGTGLLVVSVAAVVALAVGAWFTSGWLSQRPIAPGDFASYRRVFTSQLTWSVAVAVIGLALTGVTGSAWPGLAGALGSAVILAGTFPSAKRLAKHNMLFEEAGPMPVIDPDAPPPEGPAPWEDEHGGHGHGLHDHH